MELAGDGVSREERGRRRGVRVSEDEELWFRGAQLKVCGLGVEAQTNGQSSKFWRPVTLTLSDSMLRDPSRQT